MIFTFIDSGVTARPAVTWNPSDKDALIDLSLGDLYAYRASGSDSHKSVRATYGIPHTESGYFEIYIGMATSPSYYLLFGVGLATASLASFVGNDADGWGYYQGDGQKYTNNTGSAYGADYQGSSLTIGVAFKNGSLWFSKNGAWQNSGDPAANTGAAFTGITGTVYPMASLYRGTAPKDQIVGRFKTADFAYSPPSGFDPWGT